MKLLHIIKETELDKTISFSINVNAIATIECFEESETEESDPPFIAITFQGSNKVVFIPVELEDNLFETYDELCSVMEDLSAGYATSASVVMDHEGTLHQLD